MIVIACELMSEVLMSSVACSYSAGGPRLALLLSSLMLLLASLLVQVVVWVAQGREASTRT